MTRIEIAARLMEACFRKSDMMTVTLTPENALDLADRLIAEDSKRTVPERASAQPNPLYSPPATGELPPLVVEQARNLWWNIHTPDRKHYYGTDWKRYDDDSNLDPHTLGSYVTKEEAELRLPNAQLTRPDRPATIVNAEAKPAVRWRPASERPHPYTPIMMRGMSRGEACIAGPEDTTYTLGYLGENFEDTHAYVMKPTAWCYLSELI